MRTANNISVNQNVRLFPEMNFTLKCRPSISSRNLWCPKTWPLISHYLSSHDDSDGLDFSCWRVSSSHAETSTGQKTPVWSTSLWHQRTLTRFPCSDGSGHTVALRPTSPSSRSVFQTWLDSRQSCVFLDVVVLNPAPWPSSILPDFLPHTCERGLDAPAATDAPSC